MPLFVLIHSPIVGPLTWSFVAKELRSRGVEAIVPALPYEINPNQPFWKLHAGAVARELRSIPSETSLILAGHSGAGMLLPAVRQLLGRPVAGYLFVDASIPEDNQSRMDILRSELPPEVEPPDPASLKDELLPKWSEEDLREEIPDPHLRRQVVADLRPHPLAFQVEPIPVFEGWPDAPCAYLRFGPNPYYEAAARRAKSEGWPFAELEGSHFHLLVDPAAVAQSLLRLAAQASRK